MNHSIKNNRILIVDDQEDIHEDFEEMLKPSQKSSLTDNLLTAFGSNADDVSFLPELELIHARSGQEAFRIIQISLEDKKPIAVIYMDVRMPPGWDGVETTQKIREIDKDVEVVIMTAYNSKPLSEIIQNIELLHKMLYIRKPFAREEVQQVTISLVEKWNVEKELAEKNRLLQESEKMLREELKESLAKMLNVFLPICAGCKKIRDDDGTWDEIDAYIQKHTGTKFTYSICPDCTERLYSDLWESRQKSVTLSQNNIEK